MDDALASAVVELLARSPSALARIRELIAPEIQARTDAPAYTVASLAAAIGLSQRAIRSAITRGDLAAVKRGGRWLISSRAVESWTTDLSTGAPRRVRRRTTEKHVLADTFASLEPPGANPRRSSL